MADSTFQLYELVRLKPTSSFFDAFGGELTGAIVGVFQADDGDWGYCVEFYPHFPRLDAGEMGYPLEDQDLDSLGEHLKADQVDVPRSVTVRVDPETGEGHAVKGG